MILKDIINDYILSNETDYAILVDGQWGSGKTYYLKNTIRAEVEKIQVSVSEKEKESCQIVYVSLFGLKSAEDIQTKLIFEINPILKSKGLKLAGNILSKVGGFFKVNLDAKDAKNLINIFGKIPQNKIIVFDDLERLADGVLQEVLGFINTYTEHENLKVIIVADEKVLKEKVADYERVKEKLIRFTYHFDPNLKEIIPAFSSRYNDENYATFLNERRDFIAELFLKGKHKNLRTLRFVLDLFYPIFNAISNFHEIKDDATKEKIAERILYFLTTYSIEYKKGVKTELLQSLKSVGGAIGASKLDLFLSRDIRKEMIEKGQINEENIRPEDKFTDEFEETYLGDDSSPFEYFPFVVKFIHTGELNQNEQNESILSIANAYKVDVGEDYQIAKKHLDNVLALNDGEYKPLFENILKFVGDGKYKLAEYPIIFQNILNASIRGIENVSVDGNTVQIFKDGMDKSLEHSEYLPGFKNYVSMHRQENDLLKDVRNYAEKLNESINVESNRNIVNQMLEIFAPGRISELGEFLLKDENRSINFFQSDYLDPRDFIGRLKSLSNNEKLEFYGFLPNYFAIHPSNVNYNRNEYEFMKEVFQQLSEELGEEQKNTQLSTIVLERFKYLFEDVFKFNQE